jgi:hypothetical protein
MRVLLAPIALLLAAPLTFSQVPVTLRANQAQSDFTWGGTSSLGPIQGNPSNAFELAGVCELGLINLPGITTLSDTQFLSGDLLAVPDLHGKIPNVLSFLPPLATIDVLGLRLSPSSPLAPVAANGTFTTTVTLTALSGTLVVTPLGQAATTTPLAGTVSQPTLATGTLLSSANNLSLNLPVNTSFAFADPATGATGTITVTGTLIANGKLIEAFGFGDGSGTACPCANNSPAAAQSGCLNSTGVGGKLVGSGVASVSADSLLLSGSGMPATSTVLYFQGTLPANNGLGVVVGDGLRTVGGQIVRLATLANSGGASTLPSGAFGAISALGAVPATGGTRYYTAWYRNPDPAFCTAEPYNFTNGVKVVWLP